MTKRRQRLGRAGERKARRYLRRRGLKILATNWRHPLGELDIVGRDGQTLVIVEVRTSRADSFSGHPLRTVGPHKARKLAQLARAWLASARWRPSGGVRFDVIGVRRLGWWRWELTWSRAAITTEAP